MSGSSKGVGEGDGPSPGICKLKIKKNYNILIYKKNELTVILLLWKESSPPPPEKNPWSALESASIMDDYVVLSTLMIKFNHYRLRLCPLMQLYIIRGCIIRGYYIGSCLWETQKHDFLPTHMYAALILGNKDPLYVVYISNARIEKWINTERPVGHNAH